jgi:hypothetical protein
MLTPAKLIAETKGRTKITPDDVQPVDKLFLDGKTSAQMQVVFQALVVLRNWLPLGGRDKLGRRRIGRRSCV